MTEEDEEAFNIAVIEKLGLAALAHEKMSLFEVAKIMFEAACEYKESQNESSRSD